MLCFLGCNRVEEEVEQLALGARFSFATASVMDYVY